MDRITSLPILGSIPYYTTERLKESKLIIEKDSRSLISEAFRTLRTNLQFLKPRNDKLRISLSSTVGGEGKTFIAINMAAVLALSNKKVILVDLDMRKPKIHSIFGSNNARGVSTILSGQDTVEDCIRISSLENYSYLVAGPIPPNPSELILSEEFEQLLDELSMRYDIVILDTPPVGLVTDGVLVMKKSDIQLFILRAGVSNKLYLENFEKLNKIHHFSNVAFILNAIKTSRRSHYGSGYGYGYGYYSEKKSRKRFKVKI
jgi:capsular exopolysaccharide synthesis family protein